MIWWIWWKILFELFQFILCRESLAPVLVDMVRSSQTLLDPTNLPAILQKDAVYAAVGHAAFDLYDEIDFDSWLTSSLGQELDVKVGNSWLTSSYEQKLDVKVGNSWLISS